jgi:hypothetical protein
LEPSTRLDLNTLDWKNWGRNALIFLAPALLAFLVALQSGASLRQSLGFVYLWTLNTAIDLLRKFIQGTK